jgi:hypothetical protein
MLESAPMTDTLREAIYRAAVEQLKRDQGR